LKLRLKKMLIILKILRKIKQFYSLSIKGNQMFKNSVFNIKKSGLIATFTFLAVFILAESKVDKKAMKIRKSQISVKKTTKSIKGLEQNLEELLERLVNSGVIGATTLKDTEDIHSIMKNIADVNMKNTGIALGKAQDLRGQNRNAELDNATKELLHAVKDLKIARRKARMKAGKAKIRKKLRNIVRDLKKLNNETLKKSQEELGGKKVTNEKRNELSSQEKKIADTVHQLKQDLKRLLNDKSPAKPGDGKEEMKKVSDTLESKKIEKRARDIADVLEEGDLNVAAQQQKKLLNDLSKIEAHLKQDSSESKADALTDKQLTLKELQKKIEEQNEKIDEFTANHDGENLKESEEFNKLLSDQRSIKDELAKIAEDTDDNKAAKEALDKAKKRA